MDTCALSNFMTDVLRLGDYRAAVTTVLFVVRQLRQPNQKLIKYTAMNESKLFSPPKPTVCYRAGIVRRLSLWQIGFFLGMTLVLSACSFSQAQAPEEGYRPIRSPYPTFTPTSVSQALPVEDTDNNGSVAETPEPAVQPPEAIATATPLPADTPTATPDAPTSEPTAAPPRLVVSAPLVNVRAGPGVEFPIITTAERGQEYDIVGKNGAGDWWRFCCVNGEPAWVIDELVEVDGAVDTVAVSNDVVAVPPTDTPAEVAAPPAPAEPTATEPPPPPAFSFELQNAEQFPENKLVRVFLYVFDNDQALSGYSVRVTKDGGELPVSATSAGGQPGLTWPIADARQRFQNMKVEFPGIQPAGAWVVQLVDGGGNPVGPPANFTLNANDPNQELYVRYKKS